MLATNLAAVVAVAVEIIVAGRGDGSAANGRVFFDAQPLKSKERKGGCDGLKIDEHGNVWTTDAASSHVTKYSSTGTVLLDIERDYWMSAEEAVEYGLVSRIIERKTDLRSA